MQKYKLSNEYTIYKVKYDGDYPKESFIKRINQNLL